jgi:hypothetical protein
MTADNAGSDDLSLTMTKPRAGVNFINVFRAAFVCEEPKSVKKTAKLSVFLRFWDLHVQKLRIKSW